MKKLILVPGATRVLFVLAAGAICAPAHAQDGGGLAPLATAPESAVSIGLGVATGDQKDRARFGMFNGLRKDDTNVLFGFGYYNRDEALGKWLKIEGRNIGLDNQEFGLSYRRLGDFRLNLDYGEITRHDPRTINTNLTGAGTTTQSTSLLAVPGTGRDLNLELKRKGLGFDLQKSFGDFQVEVNFKNEDKSGARLFGRANACSAAYVAAGACTLAGTTALLMTPEAIDSTIRQVDAKLNYNGEKLKLSGGYYGNFYTNNVGSMTTSYTGVFGNHNGGVQAADPLAAAYFSTRPIALWPDSQAHQVFLGGNYRLSSHTKLNFKYSYTHATQNESFTGMGLTGAPAGRNDLGGVLNTTKAQLGFSTHPMDKLHLHGDVLYESKHNKTPLDFYNVHTAPPNIWTNSAMSPKKFEAKLEANYRLPYSLLLTGGAKYEREDVGTWTPTDVAGGISALRQKTDTQSYRVELRKTMSETFSGSVGYTTERRDGASSWLKPNVLPLTGVFNASGDCASVGANACVFGVNAQIPFTQKDMQRSKFRITGNWSPIERLSLQAFLDTGRDDFRGPTTSGLSNTRMYTLSLDASYELGDSWKLNGYWTGGERSLLMGHAADYDGKVKDTSSTFGAGLSGKPTERLRIGADLISMKDTLDYVMTPDSAISPANLTLLNTSGGLPDVQYKLLRLNLFGEYVVDKQSTIRLDYVHHWTFFNEWTYDGLNNGKPFLYSDNTTISAKQTQRVNFVGASYIYKFQ